MAAHAAVAARVSRRVQGHSQPQATRDKARAAGGRLTGAPAGAAAPRARARRERTVWRVKSSSCPWKSGLTARNTRWRSRTTVADLLVALGHRRQARRRRAQRRDRARVRQHATTVLERRAIASKSSSPSEEADVTHNTCSKATLHWTGRQPAKTSTASSSSSARSSSASRTRRRSRARRPRCSTATTRRHNPETLMVASLMACHHLTYLAVCERASIRVLEYSDNGTGTLAMKDGKMRMIGGRAVRRRSASPTPRRSSRRANCTRRRTRTASCPTPSTSRSRSSRP